MSKHHNDENCLIYVSCYLCGEFGYRIYKHDKYDMHRGTWYHKECLKTKGETMRKIATKTESKVKQPKAKRKYVRRAVSEGDVTSLKASIDSTKETFEQTMSMVNNALKALVSRVESLENANPKPDNFLIINVRTKEQVTVTKAEVLNLAACAPRIIAEHLYTLAENSK